MISIEESRVALNHIRPLIGGGEEPHHYSVHSVLFIACSASLTWTIVVILLLVG